MNTNDTINARVQKQSAIINALATIIAALITACVTLFIFYQKEKNANNKETGSYSGIESCKILNERLGSYKKQINIVDNDVKLVYSDIVKELEQLKKDLKCD